MFSKIANILQKDRWGFLSGLFLFAAFVWLRMGNLSISVPPDFGKRLMWAAGHPDSATVETPLDLGHLEPKGRTNPDGSEVWGYPAGSELEEVLEVHVRDGRVVREVLRPSTRRSGSQVAGVLR